jgi:hypothetical protein
MEGSTEMTYLRVSDIKLMKQEYEAIKKECSEFLQVKNSRGMTCRILWPFVLIFVKPVCL